MVLVLAAAYLRFGGMSWLQGAFYGIGAAVKVVTAKGAQYATVSTGGSYLSSSDKRVHFGLGKENTILEIPEWERDFLNFRLEGSTAKKTTPTETPGGF